MCPVDVRIVVIRKRRKPSQPYRYFCVFTSDRRLPVDYPTLQKPVAD